MKKVIIKVLEEYAKKEVNLSSEYAREMVAEDIYREVGDFLEWWGKNPTNNVRNYERE